MSQVEKHTFPVLKGKNDYSVWSQKALLIVKGAGGKSLIGKEVKSAPTLSVDESKLDEKLHSAICLSVDDLVFPIVSKTTTVHEVWWALSHRFQDSGIHAAITAIHNCFGIMQGSSESITMYISRVEAAVQHVQAIASTYLKMSDSLQAMIMLMGVSERFSSLVDSIDASSNKITSSYVEGLLIKAEQRSSQRDSTPSVQANAVSELPSKEKFCCHCWTLKSACFKPTCFNLHPEKRRRNRQPGNKSVDSTSAYSSVVSAFSSQSSFPPTSSVSMSHNDVWLLDSGCNRHIKHLSDNMVNLKSTSDIEHIQLGDNSIVESRSQVGTAVSCFNGSRITMTDTLCVPEMKKNLWSIGVSTERGLSFYMSGDNCHVYSSISSPPTGRLLMTIPKVNNLYPVTNSLPVSSPNTSASTRVNFARRSQKDLSIELWHQRMGHLNYRDLQRLSKLEGTNVNILDSDFRIPIHLLFAMDVLWGKCIVNHSLPHLESLKTLIFLRYLAWI
jgi:hypothetical protein